MHRLALAIVLAVILVTSRRLLLVGGGSGGFAVPTMPDQGQALPGSFTKYVGNPVLSLGASGAWDDAEIDGVAIFRDTRTNRYVMSYGGYSVASGVAYKIGLAYSTDLVTWTKEATNPVLSTGYNVVADTIVQLPDLTYRMYAQHYRPGSYSDVFMWTSSDLLTWTIANSGSPIVTISAGTWYETSVFDPYPVLLADGTTRLFYTGQDHFGSRGTGYAHLDTDGITILSTTLPSPLFYDGPGEIMDDIGASAALLSSTTHYGIFSDASSSAGHRWIDRLYTTDDSTFTRAEQVLQKSGSGWDSGQVFDSAPIWVGGTLYLFYCGSIITGSSSGLNAQVGMASLSWP